MRLALLVADSLKADHSGYADAHARDDDDGDDGGGDVAVEPWLCFSQHPKIRFYKTLHFPMSGTNL